MGRESVPLASCTLQHPLPSSIHLSQDLDSRVDSDRRTCACGTISRPGRRHAESLETASAGLAPIRCSAAAGEMVVGEAANQAGSTTVVTVSTVAAAQTEATAPTHLTLKLKRRRSRVRWAEDVVDNEDLCRKKSKKCCIFHRSRGLDESSDEEDGPEKLLANFLPPCSSEAAASSTE